MPSPFSSTLLTITLLTAFLSSFTAAIPHPQTSPAPNKDGAPPSCSAQDFTNYCNPKRKPWVTHLACDDLCRPTLAPGKPFDPVQCTGCLAHFLPGSNNGETLAPTGDCARHFGAGGMSGVGNMHHTASDAWTGFK